MTVEFKRRLWQEGKEGIAAFEVRECSDSEEKTYSRTSKDRKGMVEKRFALFGASSVSNLRRKPLRGRNVSVNHSFPVFVWMFWNKCINFYPTREAVVQRNVSIPEIDEAPPERAERFSAPTTFLSLPTGVGMCSLGAQCCGVIKFCAHSCL